MKNTKRQSAKLPSKICYDGWENMIEEVEKEETEMGLYDESFLIREDNKGDL